MVSFCDLKLSELKVHIKTQHTQYLHKSRAVLQYDRQTGELLQEFPSIARASRDSGEREHIIREFTRGRGVNDHRKFDWKLKNPERNDEYSQKYTHM